MDHGKMRATLLKCEISEVAWALSCVKTSQRLERSCGLTRGSVIEICSFSKVPKTPLTNILHRPGRSELVPTNEVTLI
jgi:hypothetical protein